MKIGRRITLIGLVALFVPVAAADVKLPSVINRNMVMLRQTEAPIWGWADPGEEVSIDASWQASAKTTADADGKWSVNSEGINYRLIY